MQDVSITGEKQTEEDASRQEALCRRGKLPRHLAVIMDGNGRWAQERGYSRVKGHHEGVISVRDITEACAQLGMGYLTLYTFSTENWHRPDSEVNALMRLLVHTVRRERKRLQENGIRLAAIGDMSALPEAGRKELQEAIRLTAGNTRMTLILALSYSGRWDIIQAARHLVRRAREEEVDPEEIDEQVFSQALSTSPFPDPDLLIRTGGEFRVSNFLLWQMAYTELYITNRFWPAFRRKQLYEAVEDFQDRDRRYGRIEG